MRASRICRITGSDAEALLSPTSDNKTAEQQVEAKETSTSVPIACLRVTLEKEQEEKDPIRMFAVLPPQALRTAQTDAVKMLDVVPRLVEVDSEMKEVEIRVRRARKYLSKVVDGKVVNATSTADGKKSKEEEHGVEEHGVNDEEPAMETLVEGVRKTVLV